MKKIISLCLFFILSTSCFADSSRNLSLMVGFGELYSPKSYRVGFGNWEVGLIEVGHFGLIQNYYSGSSYFSFGPTFDLITNKPGFFGAAGYDYTFTLWGTSLYIKTELNTATTVNNFSQGSFLLGLGVYW